MKIRMLVNKSGSVDGVNITTYLSGNEYIMDKTQGQIELASTFLIHNWAELVEDDKQIENPTVKRASEPSGSKAKLATRSNAK